MMLDRRRLIAGGISAAGASALTGGARAAPAFRALSLLNLHTGEALKATYWEAGGYVPEALAALNRVLRDHRTGEVHAISPALLDLVANLTAKLETRETVQIISGYRSPKTNAALHKASSGVASRSLHMDGLAMDIRIRGVPLANLRDAAWGMQAGGVGFYPGSDFVHVDVGRVRRWAG
ncbi:MAG: DUF882 domain-containing protein [Phenylobacterium sp.]|jgi:uncharacterized protein YcbK (DUF882 family)|uniref:DUF882 domain-containing protein n=1 Tax=Phenylobacterium sp. TaxID=1871053 RepID=UPI00391CBAF4